HDLIAMICKRLPCQVGGGIRTAKHAGEVLALGGKRVILGSSLINDGAIYAAFAEECAAALSAERLTFGIDSSGGRVAIKGWKEVTSIDPVEMIRVLEPHCSAFLYTHIDTEGTLTGFPMEVARKLRMETKRQLIVAGGIRSMEEVNAFDAIGVDT